MSSVLILCLPRKVLFFNISLGNFRGSVPVLKSDSILGKEDFSPAIPGAEPELSPSGTHSFLALHLGFIHRA